MNKRAVAGLVRFGVAMEASLLGRFDELLKKRSWLTRSEALRDLVRRELDRDAWETGKETVASVTLVYDHHVRELSDKLTAVQHDYGHHIISTLHVHLDHDHCMEVIAARGPAQVIKRMADQLLGMKGVLSGDVTAAALPADGEPAHAHGGEEAAPVRRKRSRR